jgi:hypothetical protein
LPAARFDHRFQERDVPAELALDLDGRRERPYENLPVARTADQEAAIGSEGGTGSQGMVVHHELAEFIAA